MTNRISSKKEDFPRSLHSFVGIFMFSAVICYKVNKFISGTCLITRVLYKHNVTTLNSTSGLSLKTNLSRNIKFNEP